MSTFIIVAVVLCIVFFLLILNEFNIINEVTDDNMSNLVGEVMIVLSLIIIFGSVITNLIRLVFRT